MIFSLKKFVNQSKGTTVVLAVAVIAGCIWFNFFRDSKKHGAAVNGVWIYSLNTGDVVVFPPETFPPVMLENGELGYGAILFSCSSCDDVSSHEVAYLTKYSEAAKAAYEREGGLVREDIGVISSPMAEMVATVEMANDNAWKPGVSRADMILEDVESKCNGSYAICSP